MQKDANQHRPPRYIGITGFAQEREVEEILSIVPSDFEHKVMLGVLANERTLAGEKQDQPMRYPRKEVLGTIFVEHKNALNLVHWNTKKPDNLVADLAEVARLTGPHTHGFQLNMRWPKPTLLRAWRESGNPAHTIVLQCGTGALKDVHMRPKALIERLREYTGLIDHILIDASGGRGVNFDPYFTRECFVAVGEAFPTLGLGVAGNLKSGTLYNLSKVRSKFHHFNIDAESGVRERSDDSFSIKEAHKYLTIAMTIFTLEKQYTVQHASSSLNSFIE